MPGRIEDYAIVGDLQTAALAGADGSVDWLCFPRFDSPACFAALLGDDTHGRWRIAPASGGRCTSRRYRGHTLVLENGYDAERGTFTQSYGSRALDACALLIPRVGFLPYDDERVVSTVETIRNELTEDGLVLRYRTDQSDDGLAGREGSFLICSFWLVHALWGIGRQREVEELFERLVSLRNDVGLLSEEYDVQAERFVGNLPQALTHLALVNCALQLANNRRER